MKTKKTLTQRRLEVVNDMIKQVKLKKIFPVEAITIAWPDPISS